jgi:hypothetical protein
MIPLNYLAKSGAQSALKPEVSFSSARVYSLYSFIFLDFDEMPNEGIGRVAPHGNQKQTREALLGARQDRRRQSSPESRTRPLPKLISLKDLQGLRHDIPPVSYTSILPFFFC